MEDKELLTSLFFGPSECPGDKRLELSGFRERNTKVLAGCLNTPKHSSILAEDELMKAL